MTDTTKKTKTRKKVEEKQEAKNCPLYRILVHNDDVTTYTFVVAVLVQIFKLEVGKASDIAQEAHYKGLALVAVLPLEQAEFRVDQAHSVARTKKYPLTLTYEPE